MRNGPWGCCTGKVIYLNLNRLNIAAITFFDERSTELGFVYKSNISLLQLEMTNCKFEGRCLKVNIFWQFFFLFLG